MTPQETELRRELNEVLAEIEALNEVLVPLYGQRNAIKAQITATYPTCVAEKERPYWVGTVIAGYTRDGAETRWGMWPGLDAVNASIRPFSEQRECVARVLREIERELHALQEAEQKRANAKAKQRQRDFFDAA